MLIKNIGINIKSEKPLQNKNHIEEWELQGWSEIIEKNASYLKPQAIENSFKRAYGEVEDNIIIHT